MPSKSVWPKPIWMTMHIFAGAFFESPTEEQRKAAVSWFESTAELLPCRVCSEHMREYIKNNPVYPHTTDRETFERYVYDFHNAVNDRTGFPVDKRPSFAEVRNAFSSHNLWPGLGGYLIPSEATMIENALKAAVASGRTSSEPCCKADNRVSWIMLAAGLLIAGATATGIAFALARKNNKERVFVR